MCVGALILIPQKNDLRLSLHQHLPRYPPAGSTLGLALLDAHRKCVYVINIPRIFVMRNFQRPVCYSPEQEHFNVDNDIDYDD